LETVQFGFLAVRADPETPKAHWACFFQTLRYMLSE